MIPIMWYREVSRGDEEPQRFDAQHGRLFLRVIERDDPSKPLEYEWGVSEKEHPFQDELNAECIARGVRKTADSAKAACRAAAKRCIR